MTGRIEDTAQQLLCVKGLRIVAIQAEAEVVAGVSFGIDAGRVLGLVGESGSGKTTAALGVLGYARRGLTIAGGEVLFKGRDVLKMTTSELTALRGGSIAYVAQDPGSALNPAIRVGAQVDEALGIHERAASKEERHQRRRQTIADVGLDRVDSILDAYPHQLSGGQQQRVMLAMAFIGRPSIILLDEPTTGLDVMTQRLVLDTVRGLCRAYSTGALYVSHDLAVVADVADVVGVMYSGSLVELGPTARVLSEPAHPYTRALLDAVPSREAGHVLHGIQGRPPDPARRPTGCAFRPRCAFAASKCLEPVPLLEAGPGHVAMCARLEAVQPAPARQAQTRESAGTRTPDKQAAIRVESLTASYGDKRVLEDVALTVPHEQCLAVVGESGSGKTTLARCIVGLHKEWRGEIEIGGRKVGPDFRQRSIEDVRRTQYIFQNPYRALNPRRTVGDLVEQPLRHFFDLSRAEREDRVRNALEAAALDPRFSVRYPGQLSGGERQRVAIARALVAEPDILVCDEITSALDVSVQAAVVELLKSLQRTRKLTLIFITHNLALVRAIADEIVVMSAGVIVERGPATSVLGEPQAEYTIDLLANAPDIETWHDKTRGGSSAVRSAELL